MHFCLWLAKYACLNTDPVKERRVIWSKYLRGQLMHSNTGNRGTQRSTDLLNLVCTKFSSRTALSRHPSVMRVCVYTHARSLSRTGFLHIINYWNRSTCAKRNFAHWINYWNRRWVRKKLQVLNLVILMVMQHARGQNETRLMRSWWRVDEARESARFVPVVNITF